MIAETVDAEGHLIDSGDLQAILTTVVEQGATYEVLRFDVGRTNADASRLSMRVATEAQESLDHLLATLATFGCHVKGAPDAIVRVNDIDGAAPRTSTRRPTTARRCSSAASGSPRSRSAWTP